MDKILFEWAQTNPYLTDTLTFNFLNAQQGSCAIVPIAGEAEIKRFIDGSAMKEYTFAFVIKLALSGSTDDTNINNILDLRKWQDWIDEQERAGNYPDFGEKYSCYELRNNANMPSLAMEFEDGSAKYMFPATIKYLEER